MLQKHLDLTTGEVVGRSKKDWAADIRSYDEGHLHMLMFADALAEGIARQFPGKVKAEMGGSPGAPQKATAGHGPRSKQ